MCFLCKPNTDAMQQELEIIISALDTCLNQQNPIGEHALITHCQHAGIEPFNQLSLKHSRELFCAHFLIKHALYTLQNRYYAEQRYHLHISATAIERRPFQAGMEALVEEDRVKHYYLNLDHYFETSEEEVNAMLNNFWRRFLAQDERSEALATLGLDGSADYAAIKKRYRELAQSQHPDKGGDAQSFQKITAAKNVLDRCYRLP